jgi:hypothetical protein
VDRHQLNQSGHAPIATVNRQEHTHRNLKNSEQIKDTEVVNQKLSNVEKFQYGRDI